jgi:hypothetical protein
LAIYSLFPFIFKDSQCAPLPSVLLARYSEVCDIAKTTFGKYARSKLELTFASCVESVWFLLVSVLRGQDPSVNVVLLEDLAAVIGVGVAGVCMGLTVHYGSAIPDAIGSLLVGGVLGGVASFLIYTNVAALVGR